MLARSGPVAAAESAGGRTPDPALHRVHRDLADHEGRGPERKAPTAERILGRSVDRWRRVWWRWMGRGRRHSVASAVAAGSVVAAREGDSDARVGGPCGDAVSQAGGHRARSRVQRRALRLGGSGRLPSRPVRPQSDADPRRSLAQDSRRAGRLVRHLAQVGVRAAAGDQQDGMVPGHGRVSDRDHGHALLLRGAPRAPIPSPASRSHPPTCAPRWSASSAAS